MCKKCDNEIEDESVISKDDIEQGVELLLNPIGYLHATSKAKAIAKELETAEADGHDVYRSDTIKRVLKRAGFTLLD